SRATFLVDPQRRRPAVGSTNEAAAIGGAAMAGETCRERRFVLQIIEIDFFPDINIAARPHHLALAVDITGRIAMMVGVAPPGVVDMDIGRQFDRPQAGTIRELAEIEFEDNLAGAETPSGNQRYLPQTIGNKRQHRQVFPSEVAINAKYGTLTEVTSPI